MKKIIRLPAAYFLLFIFGEIFIPRMAFACDACKQKQPKILQGITHGPGPTGNWEYFIVIFMVAITMYSFYAMIRSMVKPEKSRYNSIKNIILNS